jgi:hypothetical protein
MNKNNDITKLALTMVSIIGGLVVYNKFVAPKLGLKKKELPPKK